MPPMAPSAAPEALFVQKQLSVSASEMYNGMVFKMVVKKTPSDKKNYGMCYYYPFRFTQF